jgi:hypothetical protein
MTFNEVLLCVATFVGAATGQWATRRTLRSLLRSELAPMTVRVDALWLDYVRRAQGNAEERDHADA